MSERERLASGLLPEPAPAPASGPLPPRPVPAPPSPLPAWEEVYRMIAPGQQTELLALAERQGVVYAHQLPTPAANGAGNDRTRQLIMHLLLGKTEELKPLRHEPIDWEDAALDDVQREAVRKGLATPDLCLIQGRPGTGKSRVAAELVLQAARRGQRVLLLAPAAAAVDRVLEQIGTRDAVLPLRCLAADERADLLAPLIQGFTFESRRRQLGEQAVADARRALAEAEHSLERLQQQTAVLAQCGELAATAGTLEQQLEQLRGERARIPAEVEGAAQTAEAGETPAGPFGAQLSALAAGARDAQQRIDKTLAELRCQGERQQQELNGLNGALASLAPLVEAIQQGRWWTWTWWRARRQGNVCRQRDELQTRCQPVQAELERLEAESQRLAAEKDDCRRAHATQRSRLCAAEIERRSEQLGARESDLCRQRAALQERWEECRRQLDPGPAQLADLGPAAILRALEAQRERCQAGQQAIHFAHEWLDYLTSHGPELIAALLNRVNLVAAPLTALASDPRLADGVSFDLLILDGAQQVGEPELLSAARRARRWVLIGETESEEATFSANGAAESKKPVRGPGSAPRLFQRLWQQLHGEPRQLPYSWFQEHGRWCCRLMPLAAEQRQHLERECVADCPDVELRILSQPRMRPVLAEVVFPPTMPVSQAKEYIFRELQELPVQAPGRSFCWSEGPERVVLKLADCALPGLVAVALEDGVRELVSTSKSSGNGQDQGGPPAYTSCLEFDRSAGWDRARAEDWVRRHLGSRDLGRTARLDVPYRMQPALAAVLWDLLFGEQSLPRPDGHGQADGDQNPVEFVAVPDGGNSKSDSRRTAPPPRNRPSRGGAGLELDLADARHRERLPPEWRPCLPTYGFVNLAEAQAVVRMLENLARRPPPRKNGSLPAVGVIALYPAQAELIRMLVRQSPGLDKVLDLRLGAPHVFREREFSIVLISLTRSHTHRAVAYGEGPQQLTLALTRARSRVILFGDPGTLARRSQWQGAVDHLDDEAAERERHLIAELLRHFDSTPSTPTPALLHEGKYK